METLKKKYEKIVKEYVNEFEKQFEVETDTSDNFNYFFSDMFVCFLDMMYIVDNKVTFDKFVEWYDLQLNNYSNNKSVPNLKNFIEYYKGFRK